MQRGSREPPKASVNILEVEDMEANRGLQMVCEIQDQAPGTLAHERLDDACAAWDSARRRREHTRKPPGQQSGHLGA